MSPFEIPQTINLRAENAIKSYEQALVYGNKRAHRWRITVLDGKAPANLAGCTAALYISRQDGKTVRMTDEITIREETVEAIFPAEAYAVEGSTVFELDIMMGEDVVSYATLCATVRRSRTDDMIIPGTGEIYDLDALLAQIDAMKTATKAANTAAANADAKAAAANTATGNANTATGNANAGADNANKAATKINGMTIAASGLSAGASPTAALREVDGHYHIALGIPRGDTGATPQISVQVATGAAGSEASVSVSGTAKNPVIHLTIPRGDVGDIGNLTINGKAPDGSGTVTLKAADVGALAAGGTAVDSSKLGGKAPEYYLYPRNLLDNGDFSNLIAQAGLNGAHGSSPYFADRWTAYSTAGTEADGYAAITSTIKSGRIAQLVAVKSGSVYTFAAKVRCENNFYLSALLPGGTSITSKQFASGEGIYCVTFTVPGGTDTVELRFYPSYTDNGGTGNIFWAALYEGAYTADTLPPYVPKGYAAEIAECQRYYYRLEPSTSSFTYAYGYCYNETQARFNLHIPQAMVIRNPTFLYTAGTYLRVVQNGTSKDITNLSLTATVGNHALIQATSEGLASSQTAALMMAGGVFAFIADL